MIERIVRAIRLDWTVFSEIAKDRDALKEAAIIVAIVTFLSAVGTGIAAASFGAFIGDWILGIAVGWIGWAIVTYFVGTALFKGETDIPEMLRVLGYASAPFLLGLLSFIPCIGWIFPWLGGLLALVAGVIAVREAMDFDTSNAIITVIIGWIIVIVIRGVFWIF
ncbi:MAG: hypothetical protein GWN58_65500 [Anaerolineae bacterium]|nr:hypothetical protein [Anaerolineae bacterium]